MNQKTIIYNFEDDWREIEELSDLRIGDDVILCSRENVLSPVPERFYLIAHDGKGRPTNGNPAEFLYHGWLGTTDNIRRAAYGLRKVTAIRKFEKTWHITVGKDMHPDWE